MPKQITKARAYEIKQLLDELLQLAYDKRQKIEYEREQMIEKIEDDEIRVTTYWDHQIKELESLEKRVNDLRDYLFKIWYVDDLPRYDKYNPFRPINPYTKLTVGELK